MAAAAVLVIVSVPLTAVGILKLDYVIAGPTAPALDRTRETTATA